MDTPFYPKGGCCFISKEKWQYFFLIACLMQCMSFALVNFFFNLFYLEVILIKRPEGFQTETKRFSKPQCFLCIFPRKNEMKYTMPYNYYRKKKIKL